MKTRKEGATRYLLTNGVGTIFKGKKTDEILLDKQLIMALENGHTLNIAGLPPMIK